MVRGPEFKCIVALAKARRYLVRFPAQCGSIMPLDFKDK